MRWTLVIAAAVAIAGCNGDNSGPPIQPPEPPASPPVLRLIVVAGDSQLAAPGATLDSSIVVRLIDSSGVPVAGKPVQFIVSTNSGSVSAAVDSTDATGRARTRWTLQAWATTNYLTVQFDTLPPLHLMALGLILPPVRPDSLALGYGFSCHLRAGGTVWCWGEQMRSFTPVIIGGGQQFTTIAAGSFQGCGLTAAHDAYCWGTGSGTPPPGPLSATPAAAGRKLSAISVGENYACGLGLDGSAFCWGDAYYGQLGNGGNSASTAPVTVSGGLKFRMISAGHSSVCGVTLQARVWCWGRNSSGQLGTGNQASTNVPARVATSDRFVSVSIGASHACALTLDAVAWCWGQNSDNELDWISGASSNIPRRAGLDAANLFATLRVGGNSSCGITLDGRGLCWGGDGYYQLGHDQSTPWPGVGGGHHYAELQITFHHACGLTVDQAVYCWGWNIDGAIGIGQTGERAIPTAVVGGHPFTTIAAGLGHSCALTAAGAAWCWGSNDPTPKPVAGGLAFISISAGSSDCGVTITGDGYCWSGVSMPGLISGGLHFASITAGQQTCGVTTSGAAFCWGSNAEGELGDSTTTNRSGATAVAGGLTFTELAAGYLHTCGIAAGGSAWCWGADSTLGSSITGSRSYPVPVAGGLAFSHIAASGTNKVTCGITTAGAGYCWGAGYDGQLGNGTTLTGSLTPTPVSGGYSFAALSLANNSTCGFTTTGQALCWGYHGRGALGDGSGISSAVPVAVSGGHTFSSLGAAWISACAVDDVGAAWCWGGNDQGELGIGVMAIIPTPTLVTEQ